MAEDDEKPKEGEENADAVDGDGEEGGGKKKKLIIIIAAAVLLIGGGAGVFLSGMLGGGEEKAEHAEGEHGEHTEGEQSEDGKKMEGKEEASGVPVYYELPDFIVNLNTGGRRTSFLKMKVTLELSNATVVEKMDAYKPRILDAFNTYLRELRTSDLAGSAGVYRLRRELMLRIEKAVGEGVVSDILFKEIVVQ